ncbi:MAG: class A beta-lactamase-related serine hydrolase [Candidatus Omnitrophica bacterium]|nr:class A beta-lactamase-related serine hydrolase [Candidatus Omnitrophota bacterium]
MSKRNKILLTMVMAIPLVFAGIFLYDTCRESIEKNSEVMQARKASWAKLKEYVKKATKGYNGRAAIVIKDLDMNWQIDENRDMPIPSASLVKIPVMMAYFAAAEESKFRLSDTIVLKQSDKADGSGQLKNARTGSRYKIEDLLYAMITESDNTAANMLIDRMGIDELNRYFSKFGLKHTNLSRKMMDFRLRKRGVENYTTAADMAYLLEKLYRGRFLNARVSKRCLELLAEQKVNDRIPKKLPADTTVAHKTGLENGVCHDVGIVYTDKGDFLICVLTKHGYSTARLTKRFISRLSLLTYNYYGGF